MSFDGVKESGTPWSNLQKFLQPGEHVVAIVFGNWGAWHSGEVDMSYDDHDPPPIPKDKRGVLLSLEEAKPFLQSEKWAYNGGYGGADCYATFVWTDRRVIMVHEYDGSTRLTAAPRNPVACVPHFSGDD